MNWNVVLKLWHSNRFNITLEELLDGEEIALCPSCTLRIRVIYEPDNLESYVKKSAEDFSKEVSGVIVTATA